MTKDVYLCHWTNQSRHEEDNLESKESRINDVGISIGLARDYWMTRLPVANETVLSQINCPHPPVGSP